MISLSAPNPSYGSRTLTTVGSNASDIKKLSTSILSLLHLLMMAKEHIRKKAFSDGNG